MDSNERWRETEGLEKEELCAVMQFHSYIMFIMYLLPDQQISRMSLS